MIKITKTKETPENVEIYSNLLLTSETGIKVNHLLAGPEFAQLLSTSPSEEKTELVLRAVIITKNQRIQNSTHPTLIIIPPFNTFFNNK